MYFVSEIYTTPPERFETSLQKEVYQVLQKLQIPFARVHTDEAITMEDCVHINKKLNMNMVKTLFLCNRQQTTFYLFITPGDKLFDTRKFSHALGIARVSFAPEKQMAEMLETKIGAATIFSSLLVKDNQIHIVVDNDIVREEWYGCSDGTTTGYLKLRTAQVINDFLPFTGHVPAEIEV